VIVFHFGPPVPLQELHTDPPPLMIRATDLEAAIKAVAPSCLSSCVDV